MGKGGHGIREIDDVLHELDTIIDTARTHKDRVGYFAALYRQVTLEIKRGIETGFFDDGPRISYFDAVFATRYVDAVHAWQAGKEPSRCWRIAFECTERVDRLILQNLLLGINAHINLDLGIAAAKICPGQTIWGLQRDFGRINLILARLLDPVQAILVRFSPLIGVLDHVGGRRNDGAVLNFGLREAREDAWSHALMLAPEGVTQRNEAITSLDRKGTFLARLISEPSGIVGQAVNVICSAESNDTVAIINALNTIVP